MHAQQRRDSRLIGLLAVLSMILALIVGAPPVAQADETFEVDTEMDTDDADVEDDECADQFGNCSLRAAVQQANATPGADLITFADGINPTLSAVLQSGRDEDEAASGDLDLTEEVEIRGNGDTVVDASGIDRAFHVLAGPITVSSLTIQNGDVQGAGAAGAGGAFEVDTTGTGLVLADVDLTGNQAATNGGAIHVSRGDTDIDGGTADGNTAGGEGGALWNNAGFTMDVSTTVFTDNSAEGDLAPGADGADGPQTGQGGGALFNNGGTLVLDQVDVDGNDASGASGSGGGLMQVTGASGTPSTTITDSTFTANDACRAGGGIELAGGSLTITDTDFGGTGDDGNNTGPSSFTPTTCNGPGNGGAIHVTSGTTSVTGGDVTANTADAEGGGFWNNAGFTMTVTGTDFTDNVGSGDEADNGGGSLFNNGGTLVVEDVTSRGGTADGASGSGGGVLTTGGTLTITDSSIEDGSANRAGGAVESTGEATVTITNTTMSGNSAGDAPGNGGALHITGPGEVTVTTSTVSNNTAAAEGGGLWNSGAGTLLVTRSLIVDNSTTGTGDGNGGGGVFSDGGDTTVRNSTITRNDAPAAGSQVLAVAGTTVLRSVTVVEASGSSAGDGAAAVATIDDASVSLSDTIIEVAEDDACDGDIDSDGGNIVSDATCELGASGDRQSIDANVAGLADNGGPTRTHAIQASSAAAGAAVGDCPDVDQRGEDRPASGCDSGAFEVAGGDANRFVDDDDSVFEDDIERLAAARITLGCNPPTNDRFCPDDALTRQEMAAFLTRALDLPPGEESFDDVGSDNVFADDIGALQRSGITLGCNPPTNDEFCPEQLVPREQIAAFLTRALELEPGEETFRDVDDDSVFAEDIGALQRSGITRGCNPPANDRFCPDDNLTRGELAAFFVRAGLA